MSNTETTLSKWQVSYAYPNKTDLRDTYLSRKKIDSSRKTVQWLLEGEIRVYEIRQAFKM
jgi:hypothetical protein